MPTPTSPHGSRWLPRLTLRVRFALLMVLAVGFIGGAHRLYLDARILNEFENELELRTLILARHLAGESVDRLLDGDVVGLQKLLADVRDTTADVAYVFILDPTDKVVVHTFESEFPNELRLLNRYREREGYRVQRIEIFGERFRDFAMPLHHGQLGVLRLGVRDKRVLSRIALVRRELTWLVLGVMVLSASAAYLWTHFSLRPIAAITGALERFEPGRHHEMIVPRREDEIGELAVNINRITTRLHNSYAQMMQTEKMVAAGLMASGIAHEINNPISGLQNCLRRIQSKPEDVEQIQEYTTLMLQATDHIETVVRGLLNFSRSTQRRTETVDLRAVVTKALSLSEYRLRKARVDVSQRMPDESVSVRGDEGQLVQVVVNIALNAIDAMPSGGGLQIALERESEDAVLLVRDDGVGIAPEQLSRIFEPFFTTKGFGEGTGLGLAVTQAIVIDHGGRISIDSSLGAGTKVEIRLPLDRGRSQVGDEAA